MGRRIGQRIDNLYLLDNRAGPPMRDDEWQRIFMFGANMNEMNVETVNLGDELRQGAEPRFDFPPVVIRPPVPRELLDGRQLHALGLVGNRFAIRPARREYAFAQI